MKALAEKALAYLVSRAKETSTWVGLIGLLGSAGVAISPEYKELIISVGVALAGAIWTILPDAAKTPPEGDSTSSGS